MDNDIGLSHLQETMNFEDLIVFDENYDIIPDLPNRSTNDAQAANERQSSSDDDTSAFDMPKKRKLVETGSMTEYYPSYPSVSDPRESTWGHVLRFPYKLFKLLNNGDMTAMNGLVNSHLHDQCVLRWCTPANPCLLRHGKDYLKMYYHTLATAIPDCLVDVRSVKLAPSSDRLILLKTRIHFSGTFVHPGYFEKLFQMEMPMTVNYLDPSQYSPDQLKELEDENKRLLNQKKAIRMFGVTKLDFYYDQYLHKFVGLHDKAKVLSFSEAVIDDDQSDISSMSSDMSS
jgi:hypothetical protein